MPNNKSYKSYRKHQNSLKMIDTSSNHPINSITSSIMETYQKINKTQVDANECILKIHDYDRKIHLYEEELRAKNLELTFLDESLKNLLREKDDILNNNFDNSLNVLITDDKPLKITNPLLEDSSDSEESGKDFEDFEDGENISDSSDSSDSEESSDCCDPVQMQFENILSNMATDVEKIVAENDDDNNDDIGILPDSDDDKMTEFLKHANFEADI